MLALAATMLSLVCPLSADAAPRKPKPPARPTPAPAPPAPEPVAPLIEEEVDWRAIMMAPAITGNLRTLAIDPTDEKNIFVATEEGTLAHSIDGGVTWAEVVLSPFLFQSPTIGMSLAAEDSKVIDIFAGFKNRAGRYYYPYRPLGRDGAGQGVVLASPGDDPHRAHKPPAQWIFPFPFSQVAETLLGDVAGRDSKPYDEVQWVTICPGGANQVFVATLTKLLGSADGARFVELHSGRDSAPLRQVVCSPIDPNEVIFTSGDGTFRSTDGGFTFEPIGQVASSSVAFSPPSEQGTTVLFLVAGPELWVGDSAHADDMRPVPLGADGWINSVSVTQQAVWLATTAGVRASNDGGESWAMVEDLEGFSWEKIAALTAPDGREEVMVLRDDIAYISTDGGASFHPSFHGESRRRLRTVAAVPPIPGTSPTFLVLTNGELWTSAARDSKEDPSLDEVRKMAARRLKQMPALHVVLDRAVSKARLSDAQVEDLAHRSNIRGWLPGMQLGFSTSTNDIIRRETTTILAPTTKVETQSLTNIVGSINLVWELPDIVSPAFPFSPVRSNLYEIRKRLSFFIEDAYMERNQVLSQLSGGGVDGEQALTLQSRLDVLDVVIEEFTTERRR